MQEVCVIGLGYIGLPTSAVFASNGVRVKGVDINRDICETITRGGIHIVEPGLEDLVRDCVERAMLSASTVVTACNNFIIAVPTPVTADKKADLSYVVNAAEMIVPVLAHGNLVILESTVSPRCTLDVLVPVLERSGLRAGQDFMVAHCPERVLPGQIVSELVHNNRVIGGIDRRSAEAARNLYASFVKGEMYITDPTTAEMCKLMENTFRDVNIALANELAKLCEKLGISAWEVIRYANKHPRVNLHQPGPGVGGHCLAVDPWFVVESQPGTAELITLARNINDSMPKHVLDSVRRLVPGGGKVVILGCTYKPNVDDLRESPIMDLYHLLENDHNYQVSIVDPYIRQYRLSVHSELKDADLLLLGVHHTVFRDLDYGHIAQIMRTPTILDTRDFLDRVEMERLGFGYHLLGCSDATDARSSRAMTSSVASN